MALCPEASQAPHTAAACVRYLLQCAQQHSKGQGITAACCLPEESRVCQAFTWGAGKHLWGLAVRLDEGCLNAFVAVLRRITCKARELQGFRKVHWIEYMQRNLMAGSA